MANLEAIIKGSPAAFEGAVRAFDRRLCDQHDLPAGAMLIYKTHYLPNVPTKWDVTEVTVAVSDLPLAESVHRPIGGHGYTGPVMAWEWPATITAHSMPGERSHLLLQCENMIWATVVHHWRALVAELIRLGYFEEREGLLAMYQPPKQAELPAEPEPAATEAAEPAKDKSKRPGKRSDYTDHERREICVEYRAHAALGGGMTQIEFMRRFSLKDRTLRDWLNEFGL